MVAHRMRVSAMMLALSAMPLASCHSVFGLHFSRAGAPDYTKLVRIDGPSSTPDSGTATAAGRKALAAGEPGAAVESFQSALGLGEPIGPAANGLAVAYAELGRADLARRFFEQALSVDPANAQYAANLARLDDSERQLAAQSAAAIAAPVSPPAAPAQVASAPSAQPSSPMQRVSEREVKLVLGSTHPNATPPPRPNAHLSAAPAHIVVGSGFVPIVRIIFAQTRQQNAASAVRTAQNGFAPVIRLSLNQVAVATSWRLTPGRNRQALR
jgi:hypothetical protein